MNKIRRKKCEKSTFLFIKKTANNKNQSAKNALNSVIKEKEGLREVGWQKANSRIMQHSKMQYCDVRLL